MITEILRHQTPNSGGVRKTPISALVIHDTGGHTVEGTLAWFDDWRSQVSAHVVIDVNGDIYRICPDNRVAWHAGKSSLAGREGVNAFSLGVELVDDADAYPYPKPQMDACVEWTAWKVRQYRIPLNRVVGHADIAPGRKVDPGPEFPWYEFLRQVAARIDP